MKASLLSVASLFAVLCGLSIPAQAISLGGEPVERCYDLSEGAWINKVVAGLFRDFGVDDRSATEVARAAAIASTSRVIDEGRPGSFTISGLQSLVYQLMNGSFRGSLSRQYNVSCTYWDCLSNEVTMLYAGTLGRAPDAGGFDHWIQYYDNQFSVYWPVSWFNAWTHAEFDVIQGFLGSDEFNQRYARQFCVTRMVYGFNSY
jgi:hypothetical protein